MPIRSGKSTLSKSPSKHAVYGGYGIMKLSSSGIVKGGHIKVAYKGAVVTPIYNTIQYFLSALSYTSLRNLVWQTFLSRSWNGDRFAES